MAIEETFQTTFGAMFVALFVDSILYGMGLLLVLQYFRTFADRWTTGLFVGMLGVLSTTQVVCFFSWAYWDLILNFDNKPALIIIPHTGIAQLLSIFLVSFSTQIFFALRIFRLCKREQRIWLSTPIVVLAMLQLGTGIALAIGGASNGTFNVLAGQEIIQTIQSGSTAACDILITFILCLVLSRSRTGMKPTDSMLDKLIAYNINRGAVTSLAALLNMILFVVRPRAMIFMCALLPSGQLYVISVAATLLSRKSLQDDLIRSRMGSGDAAIMPLSAVQPPGVRVSTSVVTWDIGQNPSNLRDNKVPPV